MKYYEIGCIVTGFIGGILTWMFGEFDTSLQLLVFMVCCDFISGILKGGMTTGVNSKIIYKGILKKVMLFMMVALGSQVNLLFGNSVPIRDIVIMFYISMEGVSILENIGEFIPFPKKLKKLFEELNKKVEDDNE